MAKGELKGELKHQIELKLILRGPSVEDIILDYPVGPWYRLKCLRLLQIHMSNPNAQSDSVEGGVLGK